MLDTTPTITEVPDSAQDELRVTPTGEYTFEGHPVRILDRYTIDGRDFAIVQSLDGKTLQWPHSTSMRQISASDLVEVRPAVDQDNNPHCNICDHAHPFGVCQTVLYPHGPLCGCDAAGLSWQGEYSL